MSDTSFVVREKTEEEQQKEMMERISDQFYIAPIKQFLYYSPSVEIQVLRDKVSELILKFNALTLLLTEKAERMINEPLETFTGTEKTDEEVCQTP